MDQYVAIQCWFAMGARKLDFLSAAKYRNAVAALQAKACGNVTRYR
jgi:hypothetical protein